jgi:hypothetical protein
MSAQAGLRFYYETVFSLSQGKCSTSPLAVLHVLWPSHGQCLVMHGVTLAQFATPESLQVAVCADEEVLRENRRQNLKSRVPKGT